MGFVMTTGTRHVTQNCNLDRQKLEQLADLLGISRADRDALLFGGVSIHIHVSARPAAGTPPRAKRPINPGRPLSAKHSANTGCSANAIGR
jgi:hypothetical protein